MYEYPCKKYPPTIRNRKDPPAPTSDEVCNYLDEFIQEKNIKEKFCFQRTVRSILCSAEDDWIVEFDDFTTEHFFFVVVCNGLVSCKPNKIRIPGKHEFEQSGGVVLHSSERNSTTDLADKRVLIIGNGKSAVDAAVAAADIAQASNQESKPPIQLARRQTWYVPRKLVGLVPFKYIFHTRLGSSLLPRYYESVSFVAKLLHFVFAPFKWLIWRLVELLLLMQYRLPRRLWPALGTVERAALGTSVLITDERHLQRIRRGEVDMRIGTVDRLAAGNMAVLNDGTVEDVDVVILATGWQLAFDLLLESGDIMAGLDFKKDSLDFSDDGLWLYRNMLPAGFRGMAFVGSNTLTFMNIFTSYVQAYWLAQLLAGERQWPPQEHMKETIEREKVFKRKYYPEGNMRGASIEAYMRHYHDVLYREMNARRPFNCLIRPVAGLVTPVLPSTMEGCLEPAKSVKQDSLEPPRSDES